MEYTKIQQAAGNYANDRYSDSAHLIDSCYAGFKAGVEWVLEYHTIGSEKALLSQGSLSKRWVEKGKGVYPISDQQIKELSGIADLLIDSDNYKKEGWGFFKKIQEWFPDAEVFKPKRTYSVGQKFKAEGGNDFVLSTTDGGSALLISLESGWPVFSAKATEVDDVYKITESEFARICGNRPEDFTLIEPFNP
ncbi:hypothetical protein FVR03_01240 [Pontibacter qinzhouensis]|uniref:Uncharacterized protein n=1 Tax=Pontibacter qinzhouensis TaxID=2603253 RepID=A0A5C8KD63_9BACT|nr:hypothetical protein [Pontibacter qinzhouensis]TXK52368.1 hypothetical protein FVR03_01240 [Pontibacter qinzhouensis]